MTARVHDGGAGPRQAMPQWAEVARGSASVEKMKFEIESIIVALLFFFSFSFDDSWIEIM